ncbi:MAG: DUF5711 family protein [Lachnospiraceae bacterium]|nr:DUF5711 family protein [Lachnospiraceae bacterium]
MAYNRGKHTSRSRANRRYSVKKRKKRIIITAILVALAVILVVGGIWAFLRFHTYDSYKVKANLDIANSDERTNYTSFKGGYIKCAGDGITCFDKKGVIWAETFEMTQPLIDTCESYVAVADLKGSDIYIYDENGQVSRFSLSHPILDIEVSEQGVVAAATNDGTSNYIEVLDKEGKELITAKSVFTSSGYLMDITLSQDGGTLAAAFIYVSEGTLESKVVFYDFKGEGEISGGFNQYNDTIVTNVEFLNPSTVCAIGDNAITIYKVRSTPEIAYEDLDLQYEIQSVFFDKNRVGMIVEEENSDSSYTVKIFNARGRETASFGIDFPYNRVAFSGKNIMLHSVNDCAIYSFAGVQRFAYSFDERIESLLPCGNGRDYIYATANNTEFIRIK